VEDKLLKNLKWAAKKNDTDKIILHSFAHLAETKAEPHFTKALFDKVESRLKNTDYITAQTPFGYFLDLDLQAPGVSQARIFKGF
jgi:spermidine synthase